MNFRDPSELLINFEEAQAYIEGIDDPILKVLVETGRYKVLQAFMKYDNMSISDEEFEQQKPTAPFDMLFYCRVIARFFSNKTVISEYLKGNLLDDSD